MLTHKNVVSLIQAASEFFVSFISDSTLIKSYVFKRPLFNELETLISYLPLAHTYEQTIEVNSI